MERKEQTAWSYLEKEPVQLVQLSLTAHEVGDLQRALSDYRTQMLTAVNERSLTHNELHAHATIGKVQKQITKQYG